MGFRTGDGERAGEPDAIPLQGQTRSSGQPVLILEPTAVKRSAFWAPGAAFAIVRAGVAIGRIDLSGSPKMGGEAQISLRDRSFECRIHATGKAHWTYVPSRSVMYSGVVALHGANWESAKTFLTDDEKGQEPLRLRRETFGSSFAVERVSDQARVGEVRRVAQLLPKLVPLRIVPDTSLDLQETFEVLLLWIVVPRRLEEFWLNQGFVWDGTCGVRRASRCHARKIGQMIAAAAQTDRSPHAVSRAALPRGARLRGGSTRRLQMRRAPSSNCLRRWTKRGRGQVVRVERVVVQAMTGLA